MYKGWIIDVGGFKPQVIVPQRKEFDNEVNRDRGPQPLRLNVEILELLQWTVPN